LQKELQFFVTKMSFWTKTENTTTTTTTTTTHKKIKHKNACLSRGLNPRPLALKADALSLHHRVN